MTAALRPSASWLALLAAHVALVSTGGCSGTYELGTLLDAGSPDASPPTFGCGADGDATCSPPPPPYDPCGGKACGHLCTPCAADNPQCEVTVTGAIWSCNVYGACVDVGVTCGAPPASDSGASYEPCGAKACGAMCTLCAPGAPGCAESPSTKTCGKDAVCSATPKSCL